MKPNLTILALAAAIATLAPSTAIASVQGERPTLDADISRGLEADVPDGFTVAAVGDIQMTHPAARDLDFNRVATWTSEADVAFGNFESTLIDLQQFEGYPQATLDSLRPVSHPSVATALRDLGFDLLSRANNHSVDWSIDGMRYTDRALDAAGLIHAGTGETLASARAARYFSAPSGRIGLVAFTTTYEEVTPALAPLGQAPGRPGANTLPIRRTVLVDTEAMAALRRMHAAQPAGSAPTDPRPGRLYLFGTSYQASDHFGFEYELDQHALGEIARSVRQGKLSSDFLIVSIHSHEPGNWSESPASFLPVVARAMIEAGADMVVGHGPHQLRGIEIYRGKPIFYSLGNFAIQFATQEPVASDLYQRLGGDPNVMTAAELHQSRIGPHVEYNSFYESVVARTIYRNGRAARIELYPISLSLDRRMADRGIPQPATGREAQQILGRVARLSRAFGTDVEIRDGVGIIEDRPE